MKKSIRCRAVEEGRRKRRWFVIVPAEKAWLMQYWLFDRTTGFTAFHSVKVDRMNRQAAAIAVRMCRQMLAEFVAAGPPEWMKLKAEAK